jgi:hypothetical protein
MENAPSLSELSLNASYHEKMRSLIVERTMRILYLIAPQRSYPFK